jgi:hypothetical protein
MEKLLMILVTLIGVKLIGIDAACTAGGNCDDSRGGESGKIYYGSKYSFQNLNALNFQACKSLCTNCWAVDYNCQTGECILITYVESNPCVTMTCSSLYITPADNHLSFVQEGK